MQHTYKSEKRGSENKRSGLNICPLSKRVQTGLSQVLTKEDGITETVSHCQVLMMYRIIGHGNNERKTFQFPQQKLEQPTALRNVSKNRDP